jgi:prepilin-type N-terminal cleavage/methylation domain-containing protein
MMRSDKPSSTFKHSLNASGFTLVEMAVVLVVMGLVMLTVFPALIAVRSANQQALTQSNLHSLMLATAAYVQANGCLPCPATPGGTGTSFGMVGTTNNAACGTCSAPSGAINATAPQEGIPPFVSLGVPPSTAHDGWGHWITMRVDPALTSQTITPPSAQCQCSDFANAVLPTGCSPNPIGTITTPTCQTLNSSQKGLCQLNLPKVNRIGVTTPGAGTQQAAVIFVSHGSTGYGSYIADHKRSGYLLPFDLNYATCSAGGYAQCNSASNNSAQFTDASSSVGAPYAYDDVLAYADRNALVSMLGNGACNTVW